MLKNIPQRSRKYATEYDNSTMLKIHLFAPVRPPGAKRAIFKSLTGGTDYLVGAGIK